MPQPHRPSLVPFVVVVGSASFLIAWNAVRAVQVARNLAAASPAPPVASVSRKLDSAASEIGDILRQAETEPSRMRQTELAVASAHACDARGHQAATFTELATGHPAVAESLQSAGTALAAACAMRERFARSLGQAQRSAAGVEMWAYLNQALAAVQAAQSVLDAEAEEKAKSVAASPKQTERLRDPLIAIACGLACLFAARRPKPPPAPDTAETEWPTGLEPEAARETELRLLDDSGSFFFSEVFDRAPVPMVLLSPEGKIVRLNVQAEELSGQTTEQVRRQFYWDALLAESSGAGARERFEAGGQHDEPVPETWVSRDGTEHALYWSSAHFAGGLVLLAGLPAPPRDTRRVADAAHELENELTLVAGHCELALEAPQTTGRPGEDLRQLQEAVDRAVRTARRLLGGLRGLT